MVRLYEKDSVGPEGRGQGRLPVGGEASSVLAEWWSRSLYLPCQEQSEPLRGFTCLLEGKGHLIALWI